MAAANRIKFERGRVCKRGGRRTRERDRFHTGNDEFGRLFAEHDLAAESMSSLANERQLSIVRRNVLNDKFAAA
jgi:hypothetical protein